MSIFYCTSILMGATNDVILFRKAVISAAWFYVASRISIIASYQ